MSSSSDGITAFVRYLTLGEDRRNANPRLRDLIPNAARVEFNMSARELYSYGRHFPLARFVPAKQGRQALWLINGDVWRDSGGSWSLTSRHQDETRSAINSVIFDAARLKKKVGAMIVPFSALNGALIVYESIRPLEVREDRRETFAHTAKIPRSYFDAPLASRENVEKESRANDPCGTAILTTQTLSTTLPLTVSRVSNMTGETDTFRRTAKLTRSITYCGYDYSATNEDGTRGAYVDYDPAKVVYWLDSHNECVVTDDGDETVTLSWNTDRHILGDSLFSAERLIIKSSPCPNHVPSADIGANTWCETCGMGLSGNGRITNETRKRMRFVSSFDYNERAPLYFLAALPAKSRAVTVDEAISDLAPPVIHSAVARGLEVKRQGDIFLVPTPLSDADIASRAVSRTRLSFHTHGTSKPRKGELGYRAPLSAETIAKTKRERIELFRTELRRYMTEPRRPKTPSGWRAEKRRKLTELRAEIARHERRITDGENVCNQGLCQVSYGSGQGETCEKCSLPRWYDGYTVANAKNGLDRARERYAVELARPRERDLGYAARGKRPSGLCYNRALNAWRAAGQTVNERYMPSFDMAAIRRTLAVHGTGHTATEVAVAKHGVTYVRGTMRHVPEVAGERRNGDHAPVKLDGARWYLAIRNAVPRQ